MVLVCDAYKESKYVEKSDERHKIMMKALIVSNELGISVYLTACIITVYIYIVLPYNMPILTECLSPSHISMFINTNLLIKAACNYFKGHSLWSSPGADVGCLLVMPFNCHPSCGWAKLMNIRN